MSEKLPCGCEIVELEDGRKQRVPCLPHAIGQAASHLMGAADMLGHVAELVASESSKILQMPKKED